MKTILYYLSFLLLPCVLIGCSDQQAREHHIHIGVSQCSGGDWRDKMNDEMRREAIFHPGISFDFCNANDDRQKQLRDVDSLLLAGIDLLVVSPVDSLIGTDLVALANHRHVPVIVADRQTASRNYTAFVGGDNYAVGMQAAQYLINRLPEGGEVLEIRGRDGSKPVEERHRGFFDGLSGYPQFRVVSSVDGWWLRDTAKVRMEDAIHAYPELKAVFCHNDYMAMGASEMFGWVRKSQKEHGETVPEGRPVFIGVDAVYGWNHGLAWIEKGYLDASLLYPTGGDVIIRTAVSIVEGQPYAKDSILPTFVVDGRGASLLNNMDQAVIHEVDKVHWLQDRELTLLKRLDVEQVLLAVSVAFIILVIVSMIQMRRHYIERRRSAYRLVRAYRQLRDAAHRQLVELQNQSIQINNVERRDHSPLEQTLMHPFMEQVYHLIDENYGQPSFSVEQLSFLLNMSRSQLYRRVKSLAGVTPFDIIRDKRFSEASKMLASGMTFEEVAPRVGFLSVSYFEKCFEEYQKLDDEEE